jgi:hypothetical protein
VLAMSHPLVLPSANVTTSASWMRSISRLNGWPACAPVNASPSTSRYAAHDSGVGVVRETLTVMDFHHLLPAGLPAHYVMAPFLKSPLIGGGTSSIRHGLWTAAPRRAYMKAEGGRGNRSVIRDTWAWMNFQLRACR